MIITTQSCGRAGSRGNRGTVRPDRDAAGFTLVELLVVIAIIGILAFLGIPAMRGFGEANIMSAANRQLIDDVNYARQRAIAGRSPVYMVFVPPTIVPAYGAFRAADTNQVSRLVGGQYTSYALFTFRSVGDQPGRETPRYLTAWRSLPEGTLIPPAKYGGTTIFGVRPFYYESLPFPSVSSPRFSLPVIKFDFQGRLASQQDELIPLTRGSIFTHLRDSAGKPLPADVVETPRGNWTNTVNMVHIDWLTGRARIDKPGLQ